VADEPTEHFVKERLLAFQDLELLFVGGEVTTQ
jgi:hypothetical protein